MNLSIGRRLFIILPLQLILLLSLHSNHNNNVVLAQSSSSTLSTYQSSLPQTSSVDYSENRLTFVHFPPEAKPLLEREMSHIHSPLVMDVVTTVTHWKAPLWSLIKGLIHRFRNQNQIIYVRAHYYVANGLTEEGCRIEWVDTDTGVTKDIPVNSDTCAQRCTNGGRYCAPKFHDVDFPYEPRLLVEETLRRLCIDDLYHASDLKHWEYLEAFDKFQCFQQASSGSGFGLDGMTNCSKRALAEVAHTDWSSVVDCVQLAGGLDQDVMNVRLQEQLDRQQGSYNLRQVPMIHIGGIPYKGDWNVKGLLESVCSAYQRVYDITPVACDFCTNCQDVRKCLWYLECDGNPFSTDTFQPGSFQQSLQSQQQEQEPNAAAATAAPPTEAQAPPDAPPPPPSESSSSTTTTTTTTSTSNAASNAQGNSEDDTAPRPLGEESPAAETTTTNQAAQQQQQQDSFSANGNEGDDVNISGFFVGGILAGLVFGLVPAICFARDERRTRRSISAALAARNGGAGGGLGNSQGSYHDDDLLQLSLSTGVTVARPTREELQNMEDVTIDDSDPYSPTSFGSNFEAAAIEIVQPAPYRDNPSPSSASSMSSSSRRHYTGDSVRQKKTSPTRGFKSKLVNQEFV